MRASKNTSIHAYMQSALRSAEIYGPMCIMIHILQRHTCIHYLRISKKKIYIYILYRFMYLLFRLKLIPKLTGLLPFPQWVYRRSLSHLLFCRPQSCGRHVFYPPIPIPARYFWLRENQFLSIPAFNAFFICDMWACQFKSTQVEIMGRADVPATKPGRP